MALGTGQTLTFRRDEKGDVTMKKDSYITIMEPIPSQKETKIKGKLVGNYLLAEPGHYFLGTCDHRNVIVVIDERKGNFRFDGGNFIFGELWAVLREGDREPGDNWFRFGEEFGPGSISGPERYRPISGVSLDALLRLCV